MNKLHERASWIAYDDSETLFFNLLEKDGLSMVHNHTIILTDTCKPNCNKWRNAL